MTPISGASANRSNVIEPHPAAACAPAANGSTRSETRERSAAAPPSGKPSAYPVAAIADAHARARPMLLRRALRNLVDNALAYGARARLSVARDDKMVRIIVSDDGPGLTAEQIRTLVEPFARGEESRNRATGGAGLGLSIARDIAESEGGTLTLENRAGGGLDAVIALPAV